MGDCARDQIRGPGLYRPVYSRDRDVRSANPWFQYGWFAGRNGSSILRVGYSRSSVNLRHCADKLSKANGELGGVDKPIKCDEL